MTISFNLIDQPWIPCIGVNQRSGILSIRQVFRSAHLVQSITGDSPLETAALYRLLLAIAHSAWRGPENSTAWKKLWQTGSFKESWLYDYLDRWKHRFDLFDPERPFYQYHDKDMAEKPALLITHGMDTANVLFEHASIMEGLVLDPKRAASLLLVGQAFGLGGLCHPPLGITLTNAPWTRGILFLAEGSHLFETITLNLMRYTQERPMPVIGDDKPVWEMDDPFIPARQEPLGYLDYLTWQNRKLYLMPEEINGEVLVRKISIARGLDLTNIRDPWKQYSAKEKGWRHWTFQEDRSLWRDCHTLFRLNNPLDNRPPQIFEWLSNLVVEGVLDQRQAYRFMALGMGTHYKDAKIFFYREEHLPLPLAYLDTDRKEPLVELLSEAMEWANKIRSGLWGSVNTLAKFLISPNCDLPHSHQPDQKDLNNLTSHWAVERHYWSALELPFFELLEDLPNEPKLALDAWKEALRGAAWTALERIVEQAGDSPSALKASVRARAILGGALKDLFPEPRKEEITA